MGWRVPAGCRTADLFFAPSRSVRLGYALSVPVLLVLLLLVAFRRPPLAELPPPRRELETRPARALPAGRAAVVALIAGGALGFAFGARTAPAIAAAIFVVLWRGIGVRGLVAAAAALLVVAVPLLTLLVGVEDRGGYNPEYAVDRIAVHWVTVAAVVLLTLALARALGGERRRPRRA